MACAKVSIGVDFYEEFVTIERLEIGSSKSTLEDLPRTVQNVSFFALSFVLFRYLWNLVFRQGDKFRPILFLRIFRYPWNLVFERWPSGEDRKRLIRCP